MVSFQFLFFTLSVSLISILFISCSDRQLFLSGPCVFICWCIFLCWWIICFITGLVISFSIICSVFYGIVSFIVFIIMLFHSSIFWSSVSLFFFFSSMLIFVILLFALLVNSSHFAFFVLNVGVVFIIIAFAVILHIIGRWSDVIRPGSIRMLWYALSLLKIISGVVAQFL